MNRTFHLQHQILGLHMCGSQRNVHALLPEMFYGRLCFLARAIQKVHKRGEPVNATTVEAQLKASGTYEMAGGVGTIFYCILAASV